MQEGIKPRARSDIYYSDVFMKRKKGYWIIGCKETDSQLLVDGNSIEGFKRLLSLMDGNRTVEELSGKAFGSVQELEKVIEVFTAKGFLEGTICTEKFNEVERISVKFFKYKFGIFPQHIHHVCKRLVKVFYLLFIVLLLASIVVTVCNYQTLDKLTILSVISYKDISFLGSIKGYILILIFGLLMGTLHEIAHVGVSLKNGCQPSYVSGVLHLGFIPMVYVKQKNIYSLKRKHIFEVLLAGIMMNFLLFMLFYNLFFITHIEILKLFAVSNLRLVYMNLLPLSLTDGYYIFSLLVRRPNLRMNFFRCLATPGFFKKAEKDIKVYVVIYLFALFFGFNLELLIIIRMLNFNNEFIIGLVIVVNLIYIYILHLVNRMKFRKSEINFS